MRNAKQWVEIFKNTDRITENMIELVQIDVLDEVHSKLQDSMGPSLGHAKNKIDVMRNALKIKLEGTSGE